MSSRASRSLREGAIVRTLVDVASFTPAAHELEAGAEEEEASDTPSEDAITRSMKRLIVS
jgi:hypothetical protein